MKFGLPTVLGAGAAGAWAMDKYKESGLAAFVPTSSWSSLLPSNLDTLPQQLKDALASLSSRINKDGGQVRSASARMGTIWRTRGSDLARPMILRKPSHLICSAHVCTSAGGRAAGRDAQPLGQRGRPGCAAGPAHRRARGRRRARLGAAAGAAGARRRRLRLLPRDGHQRLGPLLRFQAVARAGEGESALASRGTRPRTEHARMQQPPSHQTRSSRSLDRRTTRPTAHPQVQAQVQEGMAKLWEEAQKHGEEVRRGRGSAG